MIDRLFSAALAFCLLAGGTAAIGNEMFKARPAARPMQARSVIQLPRVEVIGQRIRTEASRDLAAAESDPALRQQ
jgi:hypothetical protein